VITFEPEQIFAIQLFAIWEEARFPVAPHCASDLILVARGEPEPEAPASVPAPLSDEASV